MSSGQRPIGTARGKQSDAEALCHPRPPRSPPTPPFRTPRPCTPTMPPYPPPSLHPPAPAPPPQSSLVKSIMSIIPAKHHSGLRIRIFDHCREMFYIRLLPSVLVLLLVFCASLKRTLDEPWHRILVVTGEYHAARARTPLIVSQNVVAFLIVLYCAVHSMTSLSRHKHVYEFKPWLQRRWVLTTLAALLLQVCAGGGTDIHGLEGSGGGRGS